MSPLFSRTKKQKNSLIIAIGSASVGGALVSDREDGKANIIGTSRREMIFQEELNFKRFTASMLSALEKVLEDIEKLKKGAVKDVFCTLSSPWYIAETKKIHIEKKKKFTLRTNDIKEIAENAVLDFKKSNLIHEDIKEIEANVLQVKLNGYEVETTEGKETLRADVILYVSASPKKVLDAVTNKVRERFNYKNISFRSFTTAFFNATRDTFTNHDNFLLLDVTGEVTDIAVISSGVVSDVISFPVGKNTIVRNIASITGHPPEEALSLLRAYIDGKMKSTPEKKIESAISASKNKWSEGLSKALDVASNKHVFPRVIFIVSDSDVLGWFSSLLRVIAIEKTRLKLDEITITEVTPKILEPFTIFEGGAKRDSFLSIASLLAIKERKNLVNK